MKGMYMIIDWCDCFHPFGVFALLQFPRVYVATAPSISMLDVFGFLSTPGSLIHYCYYSNYIMCIMVKHTFPFQASCTLKTR